MIFHHICAMEGVKDKLCDAIRWQDYQRQAAGGQLVASGMSTPRYSY